MSANVWVVLNAAGAVVEIYVNPDQAAARKVVLDAVAPGHTIVIKSLVDSALLSE